MNKWIQYFRFHLFAKDAAMHPVREFLSLMLLGINESAWINYVFIHSCKILFTGKSYWNSSCFPEQPKGEHSAPCISAHTMNHITWKTMRRPKKIYISMEWLQ